MKPVFPIKPCALAALLLCAAATSSALTLGRARGAALLGQPLEMQVPIALAADEDGSALCFSADVYYGESRQETSRVLVKTELGTTGQPSMLRISARTPIDEPVVTVYVRSGCGTTTSRRYVLLADLASELAPPAPSLATTPALRMSPAGETPRATPSPAISAVGAQSEAKPSTPSVVVSAPIAVPARKAQPVRRSAAPTDAVPAAPTRRNSKSRLKLAPLDLSQDWEPTLKSSSELLAPPIENTERRLAAAAVWKALNLTPEEVLRDAVRLQDLERNVTKLSELAAQNQRQTQALIARLEASEAERYANPLVYALLAGLGILAAALVWMWRKLRQVSDAPWWNAQGPVEEPSVHDTRGGDGPASIPQAVSIPVAVDKTQQSPSAAPPPRAEAPGRMGSVDIDLDWDLDDLPPKPVAPVAKVPVATATTTERRPAARDFSPSLSSPLRAINTQEVLDIRQQAEFFMTLGQYDDAISLLENNIAENPRSNPLVYLDLLKALHILSRKVTFDHYRSAFNAVFTGQVPVYTQFNQVGAGLEAYPELCGQVAALWPTPAVIGFIETYLVRDPAAATDVQLDLEAFRDLLMLHAIAGRLGAEHPSGVVPFSAEKATEVVTTIPVADTGTVPVEAVLPATADEAENSVDLDLSDLGGAPSPTADNLIDFDASGLSLSPRKDDKPL
jgi:pilus assembly protein FimV